MLKQKFKQIIHNNLFLAFLFPFIGILMVMLFSGYCPFGKYSMLYSDMYHQYYPFFVSFRNALRSGQSLLYTWDIGLGMDYLGLIAYYLASPMNLLSVLVPEGALLPYFSMLVPIKLGLASLFFAYFLKSMFQKNDFSIAVFGGFYGTCAWALGYQWNVMWLDTFALLPLAALGTIYLIRDKKVILYTISLFFSVAINYYIGLFTCIFIFLLFFCYQICCCKRTSRFFSDLARIAVFSIIALGLTLFLTLPTLSALQTTQSSVNAFPKGFVLNIASSNTWKGLLDGMRQVAGNLGGCLEPTFKEGLPNLYCGVFSLVLAILYLGCRKIPLRERFCSFLLLLFFVFSFLFRQLDYIWHGFHFTNMIPYRFSFLFSFVMLIMAYRAWMMRGLFHPVRIVFSFTVALAIFACSDHRKDLTFIGFNLGLLIIYLCIYLYRQRRSPRRSSFLKITSTPEGDVSAFDAAGYAEAKRIYHTRRHLGSSLLLIMMSLEIILNIISFGIWFPGTYVANYPLGKQNTVSAIRYMKQLESENPFYRTETTHSQTLNDGALNGYYGITTFTSSANVAVTEFMKGLGYGAKNTYNRYCYEESSPVSDLFLGIKYRIARDGKVEENILWKDIVSYEDVHLLQNEAYLPLGFVAEKDLLTLNLNENKDNFRFQNLLFQKATGLTESVFRIVTGSDVHVKGDGVTVNFDNHTCRTSYSGASSDSSITYHFTAVYDGLVCIDLDCPKRNSFTVLHNGNLLYSEDISLPQMLSACEVKQGDTIDVRITCAKDESSTITVKAAILDNDLFRVGYNILNKSTFKIDSFSATKITGSILCDRDGLLYTSIPQNGNWNAYVDGQLTEPELVGGTMISLPLSVGNHEIAFVYKNAAFQYGAIASLISLVVFIIMVFLYREKKPGGKYLAK